MTALEEARKWAASLTDEQLRRAHIATFGDYWSRFDHQACSDELKARGIDVPVMRGN